MKQCLISPRQGRCPGRPRCSDGRPIRAKHLRNTTNKIPGPERAPSGRPRWWIKTVSKDLESDWTSLSIDKTSFQLANRSSTNKNPFVKPLWSIMAFPRPKKTHTHTHTPGQTGSLQKHHQGKTKQDAFVSAFRVQPERMRGRPERVVNDETTSDRNRQPSPKCRSPPPSPKSP